MGTKCFLLCSFPWQCANKCLTTASLKRYAHTHTDTHMQSLLYVFIICKGYVAHNLQIIKYTVWLIVNFIYLIDSHWMFSLSFAKLFYLSSTYGCRWQMNVVLTTFTALHYKWMLFDIFVDFNMQDESKTKKTYVGTSPVQLLI